MVKLYLVGDDIHRCQLLCDDVWINHRLVDIDPVRVAIVGKVFAVFRRSISCVNLLTNNFYPALIKYHFFISQLNKAIITCFWSVVNGDNHDYA